MDSTPTGNTKLTDTDAQEKALIERCRQLISSGSAVEAVKIYRAATSCGLAVAQRALGLKQ